MSYRLVLLRHGESEWNLKNLFTGWVDVDLTEELQACARGQVRLPGRRGLLKDHRRTKGIVERVRAKGTGM